MKPAAATLVDAHAHLHACFSLEAFLDGAWRNFREAADALGRPLAEGVLLLAQTRGDERFERLAAEAGMDGGRGLRAGAWSIQRTAEAESLVARRADGARLVLVCGRQLRTAEGLEVLALATASRFDDGLPIARALADALAAGALVVVPWGVGKWLGSRGRLVRDLIDSAGPALACGDSANRPVFWPTPKLLRRAAAGGLRVLPGSDPLPLRSEEARAGRAGFVLDGPLSAATPAADLAARVAVPAVCPVAYGGLESPWRFVRNQAALRAGRGAGVARAALPLALALQLAAWGCGGGPSGPEEPDPIDIGDNRPDIGWAFGDSISHGRDSQFEYRTMPLDDAGPDEPGYRRRLEAAFLADGRAIRIVEDGESGSFTADGVARIGRAVDGRPAFLVLLYGSNDAYIGLPVAQVEANLRTIVERCRRNRIIVVLCTLPPICDLVGPLPRVDLYNAAIRSLAASLANRWGGVFLADLNAAFVARGGANVCRLLNPLGVHPTREGYELVGDTVYAQLADVTWRNTP